MEREPYDDGQGKYMSGSVHHAKNIDYTVARQGNVHTGAMLMSDHDQDRGREIERTKKDRRYGEER